jgi:hypothetical protein
MLPEKCMLCAHYDEGKCCHPDPFPDVYEGEKCESFDLTEDDEVLAKAEADFERAWYTALQLQLPED